MKEKVNYVFFSYLGVFFIISIVSIYSASIYTSEVLGNLTLKQFFWYLGGLIFILGMIKFKNNFIYDNCWVLYSIGIFLLILLLLIGVPINNSKCWFIIPGIGSIQPSEFMKIFIMLSLGKLIYDFRKSSDNPNIYEEFVFLVKCFLVVLFPAILTFLQPDTGAVIIYLVIFIFMMFLSGIRIRWFLFALLLLGVIVGICGGIYFINEELFVKIFGTSMYYRIERVLMWKEGTGLQLENAISAIGSGGLLGHGFNKTPIYFPEASTDFIFACFSSNFGFIGTLLSLFVFCTFDLYIFILFKKKKNSISKYLLAGILGMLFFQQIQNIGMTIGLFPITGITLPFISYGGSSLFSYMIITGLLINISLEKEKKYS